MQIEVFLNEEKVQADIRPDMMLLDFLRSMNLKSMKRGCDTGNCGLCTVWVDGKPVLSCGVPAARVQGAHITTLEGVQEEAAEFSRFLQSGSYHECAGIKEGKSASDGRGNERISGRQSLPLYRISGTIPGVSQIF